MPEDQSWGGGSWAAFDPAGIEGSGLARWLSFLVGLLQAPGLRSRLAGPFNPVPRPGEHGASPPGPGGARPCPVTLAATEPSGLGVVGIF